MTVTQDQLIAGIIKYIDSDIGAKATGMTKFAIYFVAPSIPNVVKTKLVDIKSTGMFDDMFDTAGNIKLDLLYKRAKDAINKSGKIYFQQLNYFVDEQDIDILYTYIKGA